ncbi:DUF1275 domain-containing protein (plasmid) [Skermanella mucosa]|uniref:YoaK family protein n=1 Tax=Skermanella mucosa TaxID=1789672 RepID=UPI00192C223C|nr:YoaK family protein [Skermanella mucosa]UEM24287.1 DUF1275 domain-containing protein [Skermanella mucosa]
MLQAILLALIAGYVDTVGYLHFNAFAGLMTGNTIFLGIEAANGQYGMAMFHSVIILAFLSGVVAARVKARAGLKSWVALSVASGLLVLCSFIEKSVAAVLLALAMGMQNSAANRFNGVALNTVFITGNIQKLGEELVAWMWPNKGGPAPQGTSIFAFVWFAYAAGAGAGAVAVRFMDEPLLIPATLLPFIMFRSRPVAAA